ncbi:MAG: hypothetical protein MR908_10325 [Firmicutes bacterium]|nr:hypothetical protein [Bacillota bacterium]
MVFEWIALVCCFYCNCLVFIEKRQNNKKTNASISDFGTAIMVILDVLIVIIAWNHDFKGLYTIFTFVIVIFSIFVNILRIVARKK